MVFSFTVLTTGKGLCETGTLEESKSSSSRVLFFFFKPLEEFFKSASAWKDFSPAFRAVSGKVYLVT